MDPKKQFLLGNYFLFEFLNKSGYSIVLTWNLLQILKVEAFPFPMIPYLFDLASFEIVPSWFHFS